MTQPRDQIAQFVISALPDDITLLWDNIPPPARMVEVSHIRVSIYETDEAPTGGKYISGDVRFDIAIPFGASMQEADKIMVIIRQKICFKTSGYLTFLNRKTGIAKTIGAYHVTPVTVPFLYFDALIYG